MIKLVKTILNTFYKNINLFWLKWKLNTLEMAKFQVF